MNEAQTAGGERSHGAGSVQRGLIEERGRNKGGQQPEH